MMVISDLYMPKKNGLMLAREIQQQSTLTPVIIMTGSISENAVIFSPEAHITTVLMKPFKLVDVIEALYKALLELEKGIMEAELKQKAHYTKR
jgi:DNA-binding NtrC family response regulator